MSDWQHISTAPRDGTIVLGFSPDAVEPQMFHVIFLRGDDEPEDDGDWYVADASHGMPLDAALTHWQPLPDKPVIA